MRHLIEELSFKVHPGIPGSMTSMRGKGIIKNNYGRILQNNLLTNNTGTQRDFENLEDRINSYLIIRNIFVEYVHTNSETKLESLEIVKNNIDIIKLCVKLFGHEYIETPRTNTVVLNTLTNIINDREKTKYSYMYNDTVNEFIIYMNKLLENTPQPNNKTHFKVIPNIYLQQFSNNKYNIKFSYIIYILNELKTLSKVRLNNIVKELEKFAKNGDNLYYKLTIIAKEYKGNNSNLESKLNTVVNINNQNLTPHVNKIQKLITYYGSIWPNMTPPQRVPRIIPMRLNITYKGVYDHEPPSVKIFSDFLNYLKTVEDIPENFKIFHKNCEFYKNLYELLIHVDCTCQFTPEICRKKLDLCLPRTVIKSRNLYDQSNGSNVSIKKRQILEAYASIIHGIFSHSKVKLGINSRVGTSSISAEEFESYVIKSINHPNLSVLRRDHTISVLKRRPVVGGGNNVQSNVIIDDLEGYFLKSTTTNNQEDYRRMCIRRLQGGECPKI